MRRALHPGGGLDERENFLPLPRGRDSANRSASDSPLAALVAAAEGPHDPNRLLRPSRSPELRGSVALRSGRDRGGLSSPPGRCGAEGGDGERRAGFGRRPRSVPSGRELGHRRGVDSSIGLPLALSRGGGSRNRAMPAKNESFPTREEVREVIDLVSREAARYLESLDDRPARSGRAEAALEPFKEPMPEVGSGAVQALRLLIANGLDAAVATAGPRCFHFVIGGTTPAALGADWLASALDQMAYAWVSSPLATRLEEISLERLQELFGIPRSWQGVMTTGATMANFGRLGDTQGLRQAGPRRNRRARSRMGAVSVPAGRGFTRPGTSGESPSQCGLLPPQSRILFRGGVEHHQPETGKRPSRGRPGLGGDDDVPMEGRLAACDRQLEDAPGGHRHPRRGRSRARSSNRGVIAALLKRLSRGSAPARPVPTDRRTTSSPPAGLYGAGAGEISSKTSAVHGILSRKTVRAASA